jgi:hypothetical protein
MVFSLDGDRNNNRRIHCRPMGIGPPAGQISPQRLRKTRRCLRSENDACGHVDNAAFRVGLVAADPTPSARLWIHKNPVERQGTGRWERRRNLCGL